MRKLFLASAALVFTAGSAMALPGPSASVDITANNAAVCTVASDASGVVSVSLTVAGAQPLATFTYVCNDPDGFTRTIHSANEGQLRRLGLTTPGNFVNYSFSHGGSGDGASLTETDVSLSVDVVDAHSGIGYVTGESGATTIAIVPPVGPLFAGDFTDTITISVVP